MSLLGARRFFGGGRLRRSLLVHAYLTCRLFPIAEITGVDFIVWVFLRACVYVYYVGAQGFRRWERASDSLQLQFWMVVATT